MYRTALSTVTDGPLRVDSGAVLVFFISIFGVTTMSVHEQRVDGFDERLYLLTYPDVQYAVTQGIFESGLDHYLRHGKREGRLCQVDPIRMHSYRNYNALVDQLLSEHPEELAMAKAVGSPSVEAFKQFGDTQVKVLVAHGLMSGMRVYDIGCGSGRTAAALSRSHLQVSYQGHDINQTLVNYLNATCPGFKALATQQLKLLCDDASVDMVFHWSVFTHLFVEECFLYLKDSFRALKPGGRLVFSFLELENDHHFNQWFMPRVTAFDTHAALAHLDTFLSRGQISVMAKSIGFVDINYTDGNDATAHPAFGQSLVSMRKP